MHLRSWMHHPKVVFLGALLSVLIVIVVWVYALQESPSSPHRNDMRVPDHTFEDVTLTNIDVSGTPMYRIETPKMSHYADDDSAELESPTMQIFRDNAPPLTVHSQQAWIASGRSEILLRGEVKIFRPELDSRSTLTIETKNLRLFPEEQTATTDESVLAYTAAYRLQGVGASINLNKGHLRVHNQARGLYAP